MLKRSVLPVALAVSPGFLHAQPDLTHKVSARLWDLTTPAGQTSSGSINNVVPVGTDVIVSKAHVPTDGDTVVISAIAESDPGALAAELTAVGLQHTAVAGRVVSGRLPIGSIASLPNVASLRFARPAMAVANVGATTSQGDIALKSSVVRDSYGLTGAGVKVGILSDSFDNIPGGMDAGLASLDIPTDVLILKDYVPPVGGAIGTDEGRAMAEIVADVAPGAGIVFHTAWNGEADFADGIRALRTAGCKVIVDDVIYLEEPMFADGIIAQAVDEVVAGGVAYFSAAGNAGKQSYTSAFRNAGGADAGYHNFKTTTPADTSLNISLNLGQTWFVLQWKDNYASTGPNSPGASSDLDLEVRIYTDSTRTVVFHTFTSSIANLGADPVDTLGIDVGSSWGVAADIRIKLKNGSAPDMVKLVWYTNGVLGQQEYVTSSSTLYGHMNAAGAMAVGAARYCNTPAYGKNPPTLEAWSARGGTPIYYLPDGTPTYELRSKPDFVAPQGGNTTFFGSSSDSCGQSDSFPNFSGTSAAAPHAAGLAALMLQSRPGTSPARLADVLMATAVDMGTAGFDYDTGFGLIQADSALVQHTLPAPVLQGLFSRKTHGSRGDFDIPLTLSGKPGIENRNGSVYRLVFRFNRPISSATAAVTAGVASLGAPVAVSGSDVIVQLASVGDVQWLTVTLSEIVATDGSYAPTAVGRVGILVGDVDGSGAVTGTDVYLIRLKSGQSTDATNYRTDVDDSGAVTGTDVYLARLASGRSLPAW